MTKILLLNPYCTSSINKRTYSAEPLGLLSLATYIRDKLSVKYPSIRISIIDTYFNGVPICIKTKKGYRSGLSDVEICKLIKDADPDIIGVSNSYTAYTEDSLSLLKLANKICPNALTIIGGAHATIDHKYLITKKYIDVVVRGEGEETLREIIYNVYSKIPIKDITGITYKANDQIICNPDRALIQNLDDLPIPDRSFIDYLQYLKKSKELYFLPSRKPVGTIFSSRGCMFKCIFCSTQKVWTNKWRSRSAEKMLEEVNYLREKYGVREIAFQDDQFMGSKDRIIQLCKLIINQNLKMSFIAPSGISPALLDREVLFYLKQAGFYRICFSIDVGTKESASYVRKPINLQKVRDLIVYANHLGIWTYGTFVIGFPFETVENLVETKIFSYNLKLDFLRFYIAQPHMGSDLYDEYLKNNLIDDRVTQHHSMGDSLFGTKYISAEQLCKFREDFENDYVQFHIKHLTSIKYIVNEFIPKIFGPKKGLYFLKLLIFYLNQRFITPEKNKL